MESSNPSSSDNESVETAESLSDKDKDDMGTARISSITASREGLATNEPHITKEHGAGSNTNYSMSDRSIDPKATGGLQLEPEVGMTFHSEDQAYLFYSKYAYGKGFSVRKGHLGRRKDGTVRNRVFLCSNEGARQKHTTHLTKKPRDAVRTNCMARIEYKVTHDGVWIVSKVIYEHNHPLIRPHKAHLLRSHRRLLQTYHDVMTDALDKPVQALEFPVEETRNAEAIGFLLKDQNSYLHTNRMRGLEKGDAQVLLEFLKARKLEDPSFFYAIQLDDREQVTNFFWADARSIIDYSYFGDVVLFDTTYQINKNEIPYAPFIGINHHKHIVIFGSALLLDDTTETFLWLFKTFMVAMSGRQPKTIFTDNCVPLTRAICMILPETCHRFCLWHIIQNAPTHISNAYSTDTNFQKEFKDFVYEGGSENEFCSRWIDLTNKYNLGGNSWLADVYSSRDRWALVYQNNTFCASMTTVQWNENMKSLFKKHLNRKLPLSKFLEQYIKSLNQFREKELYEDYKSRQTKPVLLVETPMLNEAAESYTRLMYNEFEDEYKSQLSCLCEPLGMNGTLYTFRVSFPGNQSFGLVEFNPSTLTVACSCKKFEGMGILCMHALKVLSNNNILHLPTPYILKRWTKFANVEIVLDKHSILADNDSRDPLSVQYSRVCHKAITIAVKSAFSEEALQIFEQELDKLMVEVEQVLHIAPLSRQTDDEEVAILEDNQEETMDGFKKKRGRKSDAKDGLGTKGKKKHQLTSNSSNIGISNQPSQLKETSRQNNVAVDHLMINESSHVASYHRDGAASFINSVQMQPPGSTSFPPDTVMPTQESFTSSQVLFEHTNDGNIAWCAPGGSIGVPMPVMQGHSNNYGSWVVQPRRVPNVAMSQNHIDQQMHSTLPIQHQSLPRKLTFDINKGN